MSDQMIVGANSQDNVNLKDEQRHVTSQTMGGFQTSFPKIESSSLTKRGSIKPLMNQTENKIDKKNNFKAVRLKKLPVEYEMDKAQQMASNQTSSRQLKIPSNDSLHKRVKSQSTADIRKTQIVGTLFQKSQYGSQESQLMSQTQRNSIISNSQSARSLMISDEIKSKSQLIDMVKMIKLHANSDDEVVQHNIQGFLDLLRQEKQLRQLTTVDIEKGKQTIEDVINSLKQKAQFHDQRFDNGDQLCIDKTQYQGFSVDRLKQSVTSQMGLNSDIDLYGQGNSLSNLDIATDQLAHTVSRIQTLQKLGRISVFKEICLPNLIDDIKMLLKGQNYDLYTKMIKNSLMFEKLFTENIQSHTNTAAHLNQDPLSPKGTTGSKQRQFSRIEQDYKISFKMTPREKFATLNNWLIMMIKRHVSSPEFSIECLEKGECLEKCLYLFFQLFETYESVIEKRVERKRELIEIRQREKIIDDYRKQYISENESHEKLKIKYGALEKSNGQLQQEHQALNNKFKLLRRIAETMTKSSMKDFKLMNEEQRDLIQEIMKQQKGESSIIKLKVQQSSKFKESMTWRNVQQKSPEATEVDSPEHNLADLDKYYRAKIKHMKQIDKQRQKTETQKQLVIKANKDQQITGLDYFEQIEENIESIENAFNNTISDVSDEETNGQDGTNFGAYAERKRGSSFKKKNIVASSRVMPIFNRIKFISQEDTNYLRLHSQLNLNEAQMSAASEANNAARLSPYSNKGASYNHTPTTLKSPFIQSQGNIFNENLRGVSPKISQKSINEHLLQNQSTLRREKSKIQSIEIIQQFQQENEQIERFDNNQIIEEKTGDEQKSQDSQIMSNQSFLTNDQNQLGDKNADFLLNGQNDQQMFLFEQELIRQYERDPDQIKQILSTVNKNTLITEDKGIQMNQDDLEEFEFFKSFDEEKLNTFLDSVQPPTQGSGENTLSMNWKNQKKQTTRLSALKRIPTRSSFLESISEKEEEEYGDGNSSGLTLNNRFQDNGEIGGNSQGTTKGYKSQFTMQIKSMTSPTLNAILDDEQTHKLYLIKAKKARVYAQKKKILIQKQIAAAAASGQPSTPLSRKNGGPFQETNSDFDDYIKEIEIDDQASDSFDQEVFQSELPNKLLQASRAFTNMIKQLPKDEFGDLIYKGADIDDPRSQKLKDFGVRFSNLMNRLEQEHIKKSKTQLIGEQVLVTEKCLQTDISYIKEIKEQKDQNVKPARKLSISDPNFAKKSFDGYNKSTTLTSKQMPKLSASTSIGGGIPNLSSGFKQMSTNVNKMSYPQQQQVVVQPFNLGRQDFLAKSHAMNKFLINFQEYYKNKDQIKKVNQLSIKMVLKNFNQWLYDKAITAKDSIGFKNQHLSEYVYDIIQNKYGFGKITERKLRELLITILENKNRSCKLELFSRLMNLSAPYYSNNDLYFYYQLNQLFTFNDVFKSPNFLRREFFFDNHNLKAETCLEYLKMFFSGKISEDRLHTFIKEFYMMAATENKIELNEINLYKLQLKELYLESEKIYIFCIDLYRNIKVEIYLRLAKLGVISKFSPSSLIANGEEISSEGKGRTSPELKKNSSSLGGTAQLEIIEENEEVRDVALIMNYLQQTFYDFQEFVKIMMAFGEKAEFSKDSLSVLYDKGKTSRGEEKKLALEIIISYIFKFELMAL